jgi:hypothetical protein
MENIIQLTFGIMISLIGILIGLFKNTRGRTFKPSRFLGLLVVLFGFYILIYLEPHFMFEGTFHSFPLTTQIQCIDESGLMESGISCSLFVDSNEVKRLLKNARCTKDSLSNLIIIEIKDKPIIDTRHHKANSKISRNSKSSEDCIESNSRNITVIDSTTETGSCEIRRGWGGYYSYNKGGVLVMRSYYGE